MRSDALSFGQERAEDFGTGRHLDPGKLFQSHRPGQGVMVAVDAADPIDERVALLQRQMAQMLGASTSVKSAVMLDIGDALAIGMEHDPQRTSPGLVKRPEGELIAHG
jgi:hypothetical protein